MLAVVLAAFGCRAAPASEAAAEAAAKVEAPELARAGLGVGWIVWESNRSGADRIWIRALDGGAPRRLSGDEPGRDHCCAHLSPDGRRVVYLSLPAARSRSRERVKAGELHLVEIEDRRDRVVAEAARHYGGHRAAVWWSETELVYAHADGTTRRLDLTRGRDEVLARGAPDENGWLIDPTGRWATSDDPSFSDFDSASGRIRQATPLGGCEPYFTADGEYGYWVAGAGGPIDVVELAGRATRTLLRKSDPRLPGDRGYLYFPMISRDRSLLAFGASGGEHDHFRADYDIFLVELDPDRLALAGRVLRVTAHPGVDRYPDVWRLAPPRAPVRRKSVATAAAPPLAAPPPVFLWTTAEAPNRRAPGAPSELLREEGAVWTDRLGRLALAGGRFVAGNESAARVSKALPATNSFTVALLVEPRSLADADGGPLVALTRSPGDRGFLVRLLGDRVELLLRRGKPSAGEPAIALTRLADGGPHHIAFRFSPGRLAAFLDGVRVRSEVVAGDFFHWRPRHLVFGGEADGRASFRGYLSHLRIWDRELDDAELAGEARAALELARGNAAVPRRAVRARLLARSRIPSLDEISPYRRALVVEEWEALEPAADRSAERLRVARWALLDGAPTLPIALPVGTTASLTLEPFTEQPQLETAVVSDTLPPAPHLPLQFAVGLDDG